MKSAENFSENLSHLKGDTLKGSEFMFFALSQIFRDRKSTKEEIEMGIVDESFRKKKSMILVLTQYILQFKRLYRAT